MKRSPETLTALSFAAAIVAGGLLLWMPLAHGRTVVPFIDALFTATSAVCFTGLTVVDTGSGYSVTGQVIIMLLQETDSIIIVGEREKIDKLR